MAFLDEAVQQVAHESACADRALDHDSRSHNAYSSALNGGAGRGAHVGCVLPRHVAVAKPKVQR
eukprot:7387589-Prymnesium_polylepis.1